MPADANPLENVRVIVEIIGGLVVLIGGGGSLGAIIARIGKMAGTFEESNKHQTEQIIEIKDEMKKLNELMRDVAVQKAEIENLQSQITLLSKWYDDLRHGVGIIKNNG